MNSQCEAYIRLSIEIREFLLRSLSFLHDISPLLLEESRELDLLSMRVSEGGLSEAVLSGEDSEHWATEEE